MLIKATLQLNQPISNDLVLKERNNVATNNLSVRYDYHTRVTAIKMVANTMVILAAIDNTLIGKVEPSVLVNEFMTSLSLDGSIDAIREVTSTMFWTEIHSASRSFSDTENCLEPSEEGWFRFTPKPPRQYFDEYLVEDSDQQFEESPIYKTAMDRELNRICQNTNPCFVGHPVHYIVKAPVKRVLKGIHNKLVLTMLQHHRLLSRKVVTFNYDGEYNSGDPVFWDTAMVMASDGSMIIDLHDAEFMETGTYRINQIMDDLVRFMHQYNHDVLFTIRYSDEDGYAYKAFMERATGFSFVRIEPTLMNYKEAVDLLKSEALRANLDPELFITLLDHEQLQFSESEVMDVFEKQQAVLLKQLFFPEYQDITSQTMKVVQDQKGKAYQQLMNMIGLDSVKELVRKFVTFQTAKAALGDLGLPPQITSRHMVFTGNPGTAKTTVARLVGKILKDQGILLNGDFIEVGRADLVAEYLGQTAVKVRNVFKKALGGVLFIDEAYSLFEDQRGLYGDEAIATIVQEMENFREEVVVIFAGYREPMERFLNSNPGLKSRINYQIDFPDYTEAELIRIAHHIAKEHGYSLSQGAEDHLAALIRHAKSLPNFGNGRTVRNYLEQAIMNRVARLFDQVEEMPDRDAVTSLEAQDFPPLENGEELRLAYRNPKKAYN